MGRCWLFVVHPDTLDLDGQDSLEGLAQGGVFQPSSLGLWINVVSKTYAAEKPTVPPGCRYCCATTTAAQKVVHQTQDFAGEE